MTQRLLIRHGLLLPDATQAPHRADVLIEDGLVLAIGQPGSFDGPDAPPALDATDRLVMPGLVNAHSHAHGALGRGAVADVPLEGFLAAAPAINGQRGLDDLALSASLSAAELLKKGCTAVFDMCAQWPAPTLAGLHAVAAAYQAAGMRAVVAPMVADRTLYQAFPELLAALPAVQRPRLAALRAADAQACLAVVRQAASNWPFDAAQVRLGVAPTIPLLCSDAFLQGCAALSAEFDLPMQTHLAESQAQAVTGAQTYGRSLTAHLAQLGVLSPRLSVAHAIWISDDDIALLARHGVTAVHNPMSNLRLGSGVAPLRRMMDASLAVALGGDGANTADAQNLFEGARLAAYLSRLVGADATRWVGAAEALQMATVHSARALGWGERLGRIAPGLAADLLLLDLAAPHYVPLRHLLRQLVYGENGASITQVLVAGRLVVDSGRLLTIDEPALRAQAQAAAQRLDALNAEGRHLAELLQPGIASFCCGVGQAPFLLQRRLMG